MPETAPDGYNFGPFQLRQAARELRRGDEVVPLTTKTFDLLMILVQGAGRTVPKAELMAALWPDTAVAESNLTQTIFMLRKALSEDSGRAGYVVTVPRIGYKFVGEVTTVYADETTTVERTAGLTVLPLETSRSKGSKWRWVAGVLLVVTASTGYLGARRFGFYSFESKLRFQEHDWVLLGAFENRTGDALFDGTLQAALEAELTNSRFISVVPKERVEDALRLMRRAKDTRLDRALAREVCLRDGEIRALVTGRSEKLGNTYLLSVELIDPIRDRVIASNTESVIGQDQVWPAVRKLSNWLRETLGEAKEHIGLSNQQLEKATTRSLRALQLFTAADDASRHQEWAISAQLTRQALVEDPDFATAHIYLASALRNLSEPDWQPEAERAIALASGVGERERYFIFGSYEILTGHPDRAIPPFQTLVRLYPDHYFGVSNLANAYRQLGRVEEALEMERRRADMRPNDFISNSRATAFFMPFDLTQAGHYAQRAASLAPHHYETAVDLSNLINIRYFHFHELWMRDDVNGALAELQRLSQQAPDVDNPQGQRAFKFTTALCYLVLGRVQTARKLVETIEDLPYVDYHTWFLFDIGDDTSARARTGLRLDPAQGGIPVFLARYWPDRIRKLLPDMKQRLDPVQLNGMLGEMALSEERFTDAVSLLQRTFGEESQNRTAFAQLTGADLATALEKSGDEANALRVLEKVSTMRMWNVPGLTFYGVFWLRNQARVSAYYHRLGRNQEARTIDDQLRKLLAAADPDHPILQQLNQ